jgi:hypothetical protein
VNAIAVYLRHPQGKIPLANVQIAYQAGCSGQFQVSVRTDSAGRYYFCRLPKGPGCIWVFLPTEDFDTVDRVFAVTISGDHTLDLDVDR